jgi:UDP-N-acetyl-D-mannosaminuronate dehydrogenase
VSIGIVGLGYVGLPLAVSFAEAGEQVIGVDVDHGRVSELSAGRCSPPPRRSRTSCGAIS